MAKVKVKLAETGEEKIKALTGELSKIINSDGKIRSGLEKKIADNALAICKPLVEELIKLEALPKFISEEFKARILKQEKKEG